MSRRGNKAFTNSFMHNVFPPFLYSSLAFFCRQTSKHSQNSINSVCKTKMMMLVIWEEYTHFDGGIILSLIHI